MLEIPPIFRGDPTYFVMPGPNQQKQYRAIKHFSKKWEKADEEVTDWDRKCSTAQAQITKQGNKYKQTAEGAAKDGSAAFYYAKKNGPFPEGEEAIIREGYYVVEYAVDVLQGRFPRFEQNVQTFLHTLPANATHDMLFHMGYVVAPYMARVLQHQWPLLQGTQLETFLNSQNWCTYVTKLPPAPANWKEFPYNVVFC